MSAKTDPAFPFVVNDRSLNKYAMCGLTKLEWFAGMALQGLLADGSRIDLYTNIAKASFDLAEAMIAEREKRK